MIRNCESSTKSLPYEANARLRRALEKATQHKEMGPEYLYQGTPSVFLYVKPSCVVNPFLSSLIRTILCTFMKRRSLQVKVTETRDTWSSTSAAGSSGPSWPTSPDTPNPGWGGLRARPAWTASASCVTGLCLGPCLSSTLTGTICTLERCLMFTEKERVYFYTDKSPFSADNSFVQCTCARFCVRWLCRMSLDTGVWTSCSYSRAVLSSIIQRRREQIWKWMKTKKASLSHQGQAQNSVEI